jgi:hypothetical protein
VHSKDGYVFHVTASEGLRRMVTPGFALAIIDATRVFGRMKRQVYKAAGRQ